MLSERPRPTLQESPVTGGVGVTGNETREEPQKGFSSKKALEYLSLDSQDLRAHWQKFIGPSIEVPICPTFIQDLKRRQEVKIVKDKVTIIPGRMPLCVPNIPVEQVALAFGEDIKKYTGGAKVEEEKHPEWEWMLIRPDFSPSYLGSTQEDIEEFLGIRSEPGAKKPDYKDSLVPVVWGVGAYIVFRNYTEWATEEYPDKKTWSRLAGCKIGGSSNPAVRAVGAKGEGLETRIGWINHSTSDVGWRTGWVKH